MLAGVPIRIPLVTNGERVSKGTAFLLRVSTVYWKSQKKLGHLIKITEEGEVTNEIISEDYKMLVESSDQLNYKLQYMV